MLKELMKFWNNDEDSFIEETIGHFDQMIEKDKTLYKQVTDALFLGGDLPSLKEEVYAQDRQINELEQLIRRKIVTALSTDQAAAQITSSLILMSVTKDAERIGDYAKNIFEVFQKISRLNAGPNHDELLDIRNRIVASFDDVKQAFKDSDIDLAKNLLKDLDEAKKLCDQLVDSLLENQQTTNAVAYALLSRFFKRTLGHLSNIVTSIIMPVDKLDYFDEDHLEELEKTVSS